jgi:hypothetical protein
VELSDDDLDIIEVVGGAPSGEIIQGVLVDIIG